MDDAPTPIFDDFSEKNNFRQKEYLLYNDNKKYNLLVEVDLYYIYFKLYNIGEITFLYYHNKIDLKSIIYIFKLHPDLYTDLIQIFKLIEELYTQNKIFLKQNKTSMELIFKLKVNSTEYESNIYLIESEISMNEKFDLVMNEIKSIKMNSSNLLDDRLFGIELLLDDIKNDVNIRLNDEKKEIETYEKKIINNVNELKQNYQDINELKEKISNIKKHKELLNINKNEK